jgi:hypothetical protein
MIYKITLSIAGDHFYPSSIVEHLLGSLQVIDVFDPGDKIEDDERKIYDYGNISFWHPRKFAVDSDITAYEQSFLDFLSDNYERFISNGADDFQLYLEAYFDGGQCNFEIFNKKSLKLLTNFDISIPISVYPLAPDAYKAWEEEILIEWKRDSN